MFTVAERRIFRHPVNGEERCYDPLRVRRLLLAGTDGELQRVWREADRVVEAEAAGKKVSAESLEAEERLLRAGRSAFGLPEISLDGTGFGDAEVWEALEAYSRFVKKCVAEVASGPTSSARSVAGPGVAFATGTSLPSS